MNKALWSHFNHFGDCWEKFTCYSLPARLLEEFPDSKVHLQPATWLTGKFPSKRMSRHYWPVWCGYRAKIRSSVGEGEGRLVGKWVWPNGKIYPFRHQIPSDTLSYLFPSNTSLPRTRRKSNGSRIRPREVYGLNGPLCQFTKPQIDIWNVIWWLVFGFAFVLTKL